MDLLQNFVLIQALAKEVCKYYSARPMHTHALHFTYDAEAVYQNHAIDHM